METSVERLKEDRVKLTITLSPEEVDGAISDAYTRYSSQVRIAGFRSGKTPRPVIDTHVGKERVLATALEDLVETAYPRALTAEGLRPIERPDVGALDGLEPGAPYTFGAEFGVRPELELSSTEGLSISVPDAKTTDREIDSQIDYLRDRFATLEVVQDRGVQDGDFVLISFTGTVDGEPYEGNTVDKYLYELGRGQMPREFDGAMVSANAGDVVTAAFPVPETSATPEYVGKTAEFVISIHEIKSKVLPEPDDEFAANAGGFETMAEMREDIRTQLDENKETGRVRQMERAARDALMERLVGEVPQALVESRTSRLMEEFFDGLKERGVTPEQYVEATGVDPQTIRDDIANEAALQVKDELALEALFRAQGMEVTDDDIQAELARMAESQKTDVRDIMQRVEGAGAMPLLIEGIMHRHAVRWLMDNVEMPGGDATEAEASASSAEVEKPGEAATPKAKKKPAAKAAARKTAARKTAASKKDPETAVPEKSPQPADGKEE